MTLDLGLLLAVASYYAHRDAYPTLDNPGLLALLRTDAAHVALARWAEAHPVRVRLGSVSDDAADALTTQHIRAFITYAPLESERKRTHAAIESSSPGMRAWWCRTIAAHAALGRVFGGRVMADPRCVTWHGWASIAPEVAGPPSTAVPSRQYVRTVQWLERFLSFADMQTLLTAMGGTGCTLTLTSKQNGCAPCSHTYPLHRVEIDMSEANSLARIARAIQAERTLAAIADASLGAE